MNIIDNLIYGVTNLVEGTITSVVTLVSFVVSGGNPVVAVSAGAASNVIVEPLIPFDETTNGMIDAITKCSDQACIDAVATQLWWDKTYELLLAYGLYIGIGAFIVLIVWPWFTMMIGKYFMKSRREARLVKKAFDDPNMKMDDM